MFHALLSLFLASLSLESLAAIKAGELPYYGVGFYDSAKQGPELKSYLFSLLNGNHMQEQGDYDKIVPACEKGRTCFRHTTVGYGRAREVLLGDFYLVKQDGEYGVNDLYCDRVVLAHEFPGPKPGPNLVPDAGLVNTEHTWPQSRFSRNFLKDLQKADLHHLFPTNSEANSKRSSYPFGDVNSDSRPLPCSASRLGLPKSGSGLVFEPPPSHKGNVARAIFYFSVRYKLAIEEEQEAALKAWSKADPVDAEERTRNERIFSVQMNRNPFVDYPELVERIGDF